VPHIGITGHRGFNEQTTALIRKALHDVITNYEPANLIGLTCLADGADTLFAEAVLDHGGTIEVIIPATTYRDNLPPEHHVTYDRLFEQAASIRQLDFEESSSQAHMAASELMISLASELVAVWDGKPSRGYGGTADVVAEAHKMNIPVQVIWPAGLTRD
jgi:hypothetical protein